MLVGFELRAALRGLALGRSRALCLTRVCLRFGSKMPQVRILSPRCDGYNGKTYVVFGQKESNNPVELSDIAVGIGGFVIHGESTADYSGYSVSSAGDVNSDGCSDLTIGAICADTIGADGYTGKTYVVFGKRTTPLLNFLKLLQAVVVSSLRRILHDQRGWSVSSTGDVNRDGLSDHWQPLR